MLVGVSQAMSRTGSPRSVLDVHLPGVLGVDHPTVGVLQQPADHDPVLAVLPQDGHEPGAVAGDEERLHVLARDATDDDLLGDPVAQVAHDGAFRPAVDHPESVGEVPRRDQQVGGPGDDRREGAGSVVLGRGRRSIAEPSSATPAARDALRSGVIDRRTSPPSAERPVHRGQALRAAGDHPPVLETEEELVGVRDVRGERLTRPHADLGLAVGRGRLPVDGDAQAPDRRAPGAGSRPAGRPGDLGRGARAS